MADNKKYFLELSGLQALWNKMKSTFALASDVNALGGTVSGFDASIKALQSDVDGVEALTLSYAPKAADNYTAALGLAASVPAGTVIVVGADETIDGKKYLKGFYIVDNDKSVQYVGTTDGTEDADAVAALRAAVSELQNQIIKAASIVDADGNVLGGYTIANNTLLAVYDDEVVVNSDSVNALTHRAIARKFGDLEAMISTKLRFELVDTLPESDISLSTIYIVKNNSDVEDNLYTEYIYLQNKGWESLGEQKIAFDNYVTKDFLSTALNDYATTGYVDNAVSTAKTEVLASVADTLKGYATIGDIAGFTTEANILASIQSGAIGEAIAITDAQIEALQ